MAFMWFARYRDLGPERSHKKVREMYGKGTGYIQRLEKWSVQNDWVGRAAAWYTHIDRIVQEKNVAEVVAMRERHVRLAVAFQNKILQRLQTMSLGELTLSTLIRWFEVSVRIERLSRGEITSNDIIQLDKPLSELTDAELDEPLVRFCVAV